MVAEYLLQSLRHAWAALSQAQVPAAIMGGVALSAWQHLRTTRDLELLVDINSANVGPIVEQLRQAGFHTRKDPPLERIGDFEILPLFFDLPESVIQIRVDMFLARSAFHQQALARRVPFRLPESDLEVHVVACEDLIILKVIAGRIIDRADAAYLLRANRSVIDLDHLFNWCSRLRIEQDLKTIWEEAFPGEVPGPLQS